MPSTEHVIRAKLRPILAAMEKVVSEAEEDCEVSAKKAELLRRCLSQAHAVLDMRFSSARGALTAAVLT